MSEIDCKVVVGHDRLQVLAQMASDHILMHREERVLFVGYESTSSFLRAFADTSAGRLQGVRITRNRISWPSGAELYLVTMHNESDATRFARLREVGYAWIGMHDIEHWPDASVLQYLTRLLRSQDPAAPKRLRVTVDEEHGPSRAGWDWVKHRFVHHGEMPGAVLPFTGAPK